MLSVDFEDRRRGTGFKLEILVVRNPESTISRCRCLSFFLSRDRAMVRDLEGSCGFVLSEAKSSGSMLLEKLRS